MESGLVLLESTFLRRGSLGFRRRATRSNLTAGTWCIGVLLLFLGHIAILRFVELEQRRVESRRTAVGLAPLGRTSSGW